MKLSVLKNNVPLNEVQVDTSDFEEMYEIYVGRSEDCHVRIDDPLISRHHFVLKNEDSKWYCEKLSQLGVVTLNGSLVTKSTLNNGDEIKCGTYSVIISDVPKKETAPPQDLYQVPEYTYEAPKAVVEESLTKIEPVIEPIIESIEAEPSLEMDMDQDLGATESNDDELKLGDDDLMSSFGEEEEKSDLSENIDLSDGSSDGASLSLDDDISSDNNAEGSSFEGILETSEATQSLVESGNEDSTRFVKAFVKYQLTIFGEHAPYDRYNIEQDEIFIGRDTKKCQIVLNDPEVSSVHAVLRRRNSDIILEDLNSSNGTILNAERINKATLNTGDEFVIGGTSFTLEVRSELLDSESDRLMPVERDQVIEQEVIEDEEVEADDPSLNFDNDPNQEKSIFKNPAKRKKLIYVVAGLVFAYVLFFPDEEVPATKKEETKKTVEAPKKDQKAAIKLSAELENRRNVAYELGVNFFESSKFFEALNQFQTVVEIDPNYKKVSSYLEQTKVALKKLEELEAKERAEKDRIETKKLIDELLIKARAAVKERQVQVAENYFSQITEKDPENIEVSQLKMELEAWQKEQERIALEKAMKEAARKKQVDAITPGKTFYIKKEWYKAILKLEEFLRLKGMDEDLVKEASEMLSDSKNQLASELGPLLGKARSLKEGQDYKAAYEAYLEILKVEPTNAEALNEVDDIKSQLDSRSKKIYREAIIAESLSLFGDAKEKFQEVQQVSPTDSDYYKKATEKLKNYLE